jgi:hypothetical protein
MNVTRFKLFMMMVLQIAIWGAWFPQIFGYLPALGFDAWQQAMILNAFPIGAILAMFFSTQYADRHFAAEKFLAFSHLIGGLAMFGLAAVPTYFPKDPYWPFLILMYVHCIFYVPTVSITNSIAFTHMRDPKAEFGVIRMGGTIGWILVAWPFIFLLVNWSVVPAFGTVPFTDWLGKALGSPLEGAEYLKGAPSIFLVAGALSLGLAVYSLTLPHTPPRQGESLAWAEAVRLLAVPFVLVLWVVTFIDAVIHNAFFAWTFRYLEHVGIPKNWAQPVMSVGQIAEIVTMLVLGVVLKNLGYKVTMIVGILGHAARFFVFAYFPDHPWLIVAVNVLHGICYAFFFATVYIFVEQVFPQDARSSAQGLFNLMILGIGMLVANFLCPYLFDEVFTKPVDGTPVTDYRGLFLVPAGAAVVSVVILALFFHPPKKLDETTEHVGEAVV